MKKVYSWQLYDMVVKSTILCDVGFTLNPEGSLAGKTVLEVDCDLGGGISYIGERFSPKMCMATTNDTHIIEENVHDGHHGCRYVQCRPQDLLYNQDLDGKKFNIVICMNFLQELDGLVDKIKVLISILDTNGVLQVGEVIQE